MKTVYIVNAFGVATRTLKIIAGLALMAGAAQAAVIVSENFNSYPVGSSIADQPGWSLSVNSIGTITEWSEGNNYLETRPGSGSTQGKAILTFGEQTGHLQVSIDVYMQSYAAMFDLMSGNTIVTRVAFYLTPREIRVYNGPETNDYTVLASSFPYGRWYRISMDVFLDESDPSKGYYDVSIYNLTEDKAVGSVVGQSLYNNVGNIDRLAVLSTFNANAINGWDNISVVSSAIPEAGTQGMVFGLISLIAVLALRFLRNRG